MISTARILVVEDESIIGLDLVASLTELGYQTCPPVASGEEALEHIASTRPDLVLMDIFLRGNLDGIETASQIKKHYNIPIVFLTAHSDEGTLQRARQVEPYGYIVKPFSDRELNSNIEMALYKHRAEAARRTHQEDLTVLNEIGRAVTILQDVPSLLEEIYRQVQRTLPLDMFFCCLYDHTSTVVSFPLVYDRGQKYNELPRPLAAQSNTRQVIETAQPLVINRTAEEVRSHALGVYTVGDKTRSSASLLFAPLIVGHQVIGVISTQSYTLNAYTHDQVNLLAGIAHFAATGVDNARLFAAARYELEERKRAEEVLRQRNHYLAALHTITLDLLNNRDDVDSLLQTIVESAVDVLGAPNAKIMLKSGDGLEVRACVPNDPLMRGYKFGRNQAALTWQVYDSRQLISIDDYATLIGPAALAGMPPLRAMVEFPIIAADECLGVLALARDAVGQVFSAEETELGQRLSNLTALALTNVNLYQAAQHEIEERKLAETALSISEQKYRAVVEQIPVVTYSALREGAARVDNLYTSPQIATLLGFSAAEWMADPDLWYRQLHPDDRERVMAEHAQSRIANRNFNAEYRLRARDGRIVWVHDEAHLVVAQVGEASFTQGAMIDITERRRAEEALRQSEAFNIAVLNSLTAHVAVLDVTGNIVAVNTAWQRFSQENAGQTHFKNGVGTNYLAVCETSFRQTKDEKIELVLTAIRAVIDGSQLRFSLEYPCHSPTEKRWFVMNVSPLSGSHSEVVVAHENITERKQVEEEIRRAYAALEVANRRLEEAFTREQILARTDGLTGVHNRRYFFDLAAHEFITATRYGHPLSLIMFDIDHFKGINDTYGHHIGDAILKSVAQLASVDLRASDILARYGGEEFVLLLPNTNASRAMIVAERIRIAVATHRFADTSSQGFVTISIGVAEIYRQNDTLDRLSQRVDQALYEAKAAGRNRVMIFGQPTDSVV